MVEEMEGRGLTRKKAVKSPSIREYRERRGATGQMGGEAERDGLDLVDFDPIVVKKYSCFWPRKGPQSHRPTVYYASAQFTTGNPPTNHHEPPIPLLFCAEGCDGGCPDVTF